MIVATPRLLAQDIDAIDRVWQLQQTLAPTLAETSRWTGTLRRQSLGRVIQASNSIEGYSAELSAVQNVLLNGDQTGTDFETQRALLGYRNAMTFGLQLAKDAEPIHFDQNLLRSLHFMLLDGQLKLRAGSFRQGPVYVQNAAGFRVHEGAPADQVPALVAEVLNSLNSQDGVPIIDAAMAHLNLVLIHPFKDGNGRIARVVHSLGLARSSKLSPVFLSIEEYLARETEAYYRVLATVGCGSWQPNADARPWLRFVLEAHWQQAHSVLQNNRTVNSLWAEAAQLVDKLGLPERSVPALVHLLTGNQLNNASYRGLLAESGDPVKSLTASRDLAILEAAGLLASSGETKARSYRMGRPLLEIAQAVGHKTALAAPQPLFG